MIDEAMHVRKVSEASFANLAVLLTLFLRAAKSIVISALRDQIVGLRWHFANFTHMRQ